MEADAYKLLLMEWDLFNFVEQFEAEGIDDVSFDLLDEETIKTIFRQAGPRLKFKKHLKDYLQKKQGQLDTLIFFDNETSSTASTDTIPSAASNQSSSSADQVLFEPDDELKEALRIFDDQNKNASKGSSQTALHLEPQFKKPRLVSNDFSVTIENMEELLQKNPEGQMILLNKNKLTNVQRQKLANICVNELIARFGPELNQNILYRTAKQIESVCPNEISHVYMITTAFGGPKGKLWNRYRNIKKVLHSVEKCKRSRSEEKENGSLTESENIQDENIDFLRVAIEPYQKVVEAWQETHKLRKKMYMNEELKLYDDFPCLALNEGINLLEIDFNIQYPDKIDNIYSNWEMVRNACLQEINDRKVNIVNNCTDGVVDQDILMIMGLPYLFPPVTIKSSRKGSAWRPTRSEVMESFFLVIDDISNLPERLQKRKAKLDELNIKLEPFGIIAGDLKKPGLFLWIQNTTYKVDSVIRSVELLFKAIYALRREYPSECEHIWLALSELIFGMKPVKKNSSTAAVVSDILYHLKSKNK